MSAKKQSQEKNWKNFESTRKGVATTSFFFVQFSNKTKKNLSVLWKLFKQFPSVYRARIEATVNLIWQSKIATVVLFSETDNERVHINNKAELVSVKFRQIKVKFGQVESELWCKTVIETLKENKIAGQRPA